MTDLNRTGFTSITVGDKHYWFPFLPAEDGKMKVLLPTGGSEFVLIDSIDTLVNWFFKAFPNAVIEAREIKKVEEPAAEVSELKCPKCGCKDVKKNGIDLKNRRRFMCKHCHRTFTSNILAS